MNCLDHRRQRSGVEATVPTSIYEGSVSSSTFPDLFNATFSWRHESIQTAGNRFNHQFKIWNANIRRIAIQLARRIVPDAQAGQEAVPANNEPNPPINQSATLMPVPRTLHLLWKEWHHGVGGRKPARLFMARERGLFKHKFHRRKLVWDLIVGLIRGGLTANVA